RTHDGPASDEWPVTGESHAPSAQEPLTADEVVAASGEGQGWSESSTTEPTTGATAAGARGAGYETVDETVDETDHSADGGTGTDDVDSTGTSPVFAQSVYGPGSADPLDDGTGPAGWAIKGNVGSMLFHTTDSPSYDAVRAEVWFESEEAAREAGFAHWDRRRR
ncbi:MAG TPA: hypothetical protein VLO09_07510, partial [Ornithinimicrobium sp.]|nr:hypothetical protein [Ornithinimicrobium sp.]